MPFGILDYYRVPSSIWFAFLMVDCCELLLGSSLFSEVLRTNSIVRGLTREYRSGKKVLNLFLRYIHFLIEALLLVEYII